MAMLVIITTIAYNMHVSWRVRMQELRNVQTPLLYELLEACPPPCDAVAGDL